MKYLTLTRQTDQKEATTGTLEGHGIKLRTLELPWQGNQANLSCIPEGEYLVTPHGWHKKSKVKYKKTYKLRNTTPRSAILIHVGNYLTNTRGCVLVGMVEGRAEGKPTVWRSKEAMDILRDLVGEEPFKIHITKEGN